MKIVLSGVLEGISTRGDGSVKVTLGSQEIDSHEIGKLYDLRNKFIKIMFSDNNITPLDEQLIDDLAIKDGKKVKTPSQRQRAVYYRIWEQEGKNGAFEDYYAGQMESHIDYLKNRLERI